MHNFLFNFFSLLLMAVAARINDCPNNTYIALRSVTSDFGNIVYAELTNVEDWEFDAVNFYELYDIDKDPYQLTSILHICSTK